MKGLPPVQVCPSVDNLHEGCLGEVTHRGGAVTSPIPPPLSFPSLQSVDTELKAAQGEYRPTVSLAKPKLIAKLKPPPSEAIGQKIKARPAKKQSRIPFNKSNNKSIKEMFNPADTKIETTAAQFTSTGKYPINSENLGVVKTGDVPRPHGNIPCDLTHNNLPEKEKNTPVTGVSDTIPGPTAYDLNETDQKISDKSTKNVATPTKYPILVDSNTLSECQVSWQPSLLQYGAYRRLRKPDPPENSSQGLAGSPKGQFIQHSLSQQLILETGPEDEMKTKSEKEELRINVND